MVITTTAIGFFLSSIGFTFCGIWFLRAFQKIGGRESGKKIGILLSSFFIGVAIQHAFMSIGSFFLADEPSRLYIVLTVANLLLTLTTSLIVYLAFYIFSPHVSPWIATISTFVLGMFVVGITFITRPQSFINTQGSIDWNMSSTLEILLAYLLLIHIGIPLYIFLKSFFHAESREVKTISLIIIITSVIGITNILFNFTLLLDIPSDIQARFFDIAVASIGFILIFSLVVIPLIFAQFIDSNKKETW